MRVRVFSGFINVLTMVLTVLNVIGRYAMMRDCWMETPADRPNFTALVQRLDHVIESNIPAMVSVTIINDVNVFLVVLR